VAKNQKAFLVVKEIATKEIATMTTSEAISIPEPPNVFIYRGETRGDIPDDVTHVKTDHSVKEIHVETTATVLTDCRPRRLRWSLLLE
jgi:hypothetical protein